MCMLSHVWIELTFLGRSVCSLTRMTADRIQHEASIAMISPNPPPPLNPSTHQEEETYLYIHIIHI